jgi:hypothetical protein
MDPPGDLRGVGADRPRRDSLTTCQRSRKTYYHLKDIVLADHIRDPIEITVRALVTTYRLQRSGEDAARITECEPDPDAADVDPQPDARAHRVRTPG